jgi:phenylacetate-coenzyme A ligase PaaK-like adenylate-forming protein
LGCDHSLLPSSPFTPHYPPEYYHHSLNVLETALNHVPAYQPWQAFDLNGESSIDTRYAAMPIFTKQEIKKNFPEGLLPRDRNIEEGLASGEIEFVKTSGTIDESVTNIWNQKWWNASEEASWKLNSHANKLATGHHREAILASSLNVGFVSDDANLPMNKRRLGRFLYLNEKTDSSLWTSTHMDRMIKELKVFKPAILEANPSLLAKLCRYIASSGKAVFQPGLIVFTYEYPSVLHSKQIRQVFHVPTASSYGSTETGYVFMQCEQGKFHQNIEFCRVDFQPFKEEHGGPYLGRILVTTFHNPWTYLVRYNIGDLVRVDKQSYCNCGRNSGLILSAVEGRTKDITLTCGGRLVTLRELDHTLGVLEGIEEYQLRQVSHSSYRLHLASQRSDQKNLAEEAINALKQLYGHNAEVSVIHVKAVIPEASGKYRLSSASFPLKIENFLDERYLSKKKVDSHI